MALLHRMLPWLRRNCCGGTAISLTIWLAVVSGYDKTFALEDVEVDQIYDLVVARHVLGLLIGVTRNLHGIVSPHDMDYADLYGSSLETLLSARSRQSPCHTPFGLPVPGSTARQHPLTPGTHQATTDDLLLRRQKVLGTALPIFYDSPVHTVRGEGVWLYDMDGRRYLDCYNNVPHVGHCHPHVVKAVSRQAAALNTHSRYLFGNIIEYAERIGALMPGDLSACLFVNSGSEANDMALRMAKVCTGQDGALIVDGAYHGITNEIYALSPSAEWGMHEDGGNGHVSAFRTDIETVENPDTVRGRFGADDPDAGEKYAADVDPAAAVLAAAGTSGRCFHGGFCLCHPWHSRCAAGIRRRRQPTHSCRWWHDHRR